LFSCQRKISHEEKKVGKADGEILYIYLTQKNGQKLLIHTKCIIQRKVFLTKNLKFDKIISLKI